MPNFSLSSSSTVCLHLAVLLSFFIMFYIFFQPKLKVFVPAEKDGCVPYEIADRGLPNDSSSFVTAGGNCTLFDKFYNAYKGHAKQVILIADKNEVLVSEQKKKSYILITKHS